MAGERTRYDSGLMQENVVHHLIENPYPGQGIMIGNMGGNEQLVQAYWEVAQASTDRIELVAFDEHGNVHARQALGVAAQEAAWDEFQPMIVTRNPQCHIVANGELTSQALHTLAGPAKNIFTPCLTSARRTAYGTEFSPRIAGRLRAGNGEYDFHVTNRQNPTTNEPVSESSGGTLSVVPKGVGLAVHTHAGLPTTEDEQPPIFTGDVYALPIEGESAKDVANYLKRKLGQKPVALVVKTINRKNGSIAMHIVNPVQDTEAGE